LQDLDPSHHRCLREQLAKKPSQVAPLGQLRGRSKFRTGWAASWYGLHCFAITHGAAGTGPNVISARNSPAEERVFFAPLAPGRATAERLVRKWLAASTLNR